jgi:hypothetical protein
MTLITDEQIAKLRANGRATLEAIRAGRDIDPTPVVKLYTPDTYCRWLLTELDPNGSDWAFGLFDLGSGHPQLGYIRLRDIEGMQGKTGYRVVRDQNFIADQPLSIYVKVAYLRGLIIT